MPQLPSESWLLGAAPSSLRNFTKEPLFSQGVSEAMAGSSLEETSNNPAAGGRAPNGGSLTQKEAPGWGWGGNVQHHLGDPWEVSQLPDLLKASQAGLGEPAGQLHKPPLQLTPKWKNTT